MNRIKKYLGLLWMVLGPVFLFMLMKSAFDNIIIGGKADINNPVPWIIIITVFTPVAIGLSIFGYYAWKGEYDSIQD